MPDLNYPFTMHKNEEQTVGFSRFVMREENGSYCKGLLDNNPISTQPDIFCSLKCLIRHWKQTS